MRTALLFACVTILPAGLAAQSASSLSAGVREFVQVDAPVVALTHVQVVDGTGAPAASDQTIVLRDGRIAAVGPSDTVAVPSDAEVLDLTGHTVIPGIIGFARPHVLHDPRPTRAAELQCPASLPGQRGHYDPDHRGVLAVQRAQPEELDRQRRAARAANVYHRAVYHRHRGEHADEGGLVAGGRAPCGRLLGRRRGRLVQGVYPHRTRRAGGRHRRGAPGAASR